MPTHITVNGLGLTHKSSTGFSKATIPDVCKTPTPGGPVPMPYPNFAMSSTLGDGTTTVFAKGGQMIANKGSQYKMSTGDEPGTVGGVKSNTFKQATDWITYSFDVKMDGSNACRDTDKKFHNNKNTVDLMGNLNPTPPATPLPPFEIDCADAPKNPQDGQKFGECDKEEICGKIAAMEAERQNGTLMRTRKHSDAVYNAERAAGDAICDRINNHARNGRGADGFGEPEDLGFHDMSDGCLEYKKQKAADQNYQGFSPDHRHEIQLGGHPTDPSNLVWMESKTNSWIGGQFSHYDPDVQGEISGNCCD